MGSNRLITAIGRLDQALARLEHALPSRLASADGEALATLATRHERLRDATENAIARLDALIATAEG